MTNLRRTLSLAVVAAAALSLSACAQADNDRSGSAGGKNPDGLGNTSHVLVYRNADKVPNVAYFCAGPYGWASTLSGGDNSASKASSLVRFPDYDEKCKGEELPSTN